MYNNKQATRRLSRLYDVVDCMNKGMDTKQISEFLDEPLRTIQKDVKFIRENQPEKA